MVGLDVVMGWFLVLLWRVFVVVDFLVECCLFCFCFDLLVGLLWVGFVFVVVAVGAVCLSVLGRGGWCFELVVDF